MALIIFIMAILSTAFSAAMTTFRNLKAAGDMAEKLRATIQLLQRDLASDHFEGKKRPSDPNFWQNGPPQQGFFQIYQGSDQNSPGGTLEGTDLDTIGSHLNTDHALAFTIKMRGNQMGDFLSASAPLLSMAGSPGLPPEARYQLTSGVSYNYQWAEVAWFLQPSINPTTGQQDTTFADQVALAQSGGTVGNPIPLYTLYRRQRLAVPDNSRVTSVPYNSTNYSQCLELSCWNNNGTLYFNSPSDLTVPERRFGGIIAAAEAPNALPITGPSTTLAQDLGALGVSNPGLSGSDIQLTNVVSFDVRVLTADSYGYASTNSIIDPFVTLADPAFSSNYTYTPPSSNPPSSWAPPAAVIFDTWSALNDHVGPSYEQWNATTIQQPGGLPLPYVIPFWPNSVDVISVPTSAPAGPIIQAIQISIRIWDYKTNQTRQVTFVQAM
jgi:hypothetical protein